MSFLSLGLLFLLIASALIVVAAMRWAVRPPASAFRILVLGISSLGMALGIGAIAADVARTDGRSSSEILAFVIAVNYTFAGLVLLGKYRSVCRMRRLGP